MVRHLHYIALADGVFAIMVRNGAVDSMYYVHPDHLGSYAIVTDALGNVKQRAEYDPWGKRILSEGSLKFDRGFTGHEHLSPFGGVGGGLIDMNGRLYDPVIGRFLSPDPYIQAPDFSQSFNRYSYCVNNPLRYTDPDGKWIHIVIGAVIGGVINVATHWSKIHNFGDFAVAFGIGAVSGAVCAATGGAFFAAAGGAAGGAGGFIAGALGSMAGTAFSEPIQSLGNMVYFGDQPLTFNAYMKDIAMSGLIGGGLNGASALANDRNFFTGNIRPVPTSPIVPPTMMPNPEMEKMEPLADPRTPIKVNNTPSGMDVPQQNSSLILNSKGVPYPDVTVEGYGKVPFPDGPYTPNNSLSLRPDFTPQYKADFKNWWMEQGRPWPTAPAGSIVNIHHIQPLQFGGTNVFDNLVPLVQPIQHQPFTNWWAGFRITVNF